MTKITLMTVLKPFNYSEDGVHVRPLAPGDVAEIRDDMVGDLVAGGYLEDPAPGKGGRTPRPAVARGKR